jgi:hypothetical protein
MLLLSFKKKQAEEIFMKYCPSCRIKYADDSLRFCLQDGTGLLDDGDNAPAPTVDFSERETVVRQKPVTSAFEESRVTQGARVEPAAKNRSSFPAIIVTALVMCVFFGGIIAAWKMLGGSASGNAGSRNKTSTPTITPAIDRTPVTPDVSERWQPIDYNASLNGERLTYYRGTTPEQCKADCDGNPNCQGFTLIRAGVYNPSDPPMCYLLSQVTSSTPSSCCISAIKK